MFGDGVRPVHLPPKKGRGQRCHQVNRAGPFPGRSPGVVESGLTVSERVRSLERTIRVSSRNDEAGRSFLLVPERIDYSQTILDKLISIKGFRTNRIL